MNRIFISLKSVDNRVKNLAFYSLLLIFWLITLDNLGTFLKSEDTCSYQSTLYQFYEVLAKYMAILLNICYSIFASCIFYFFTIHLPEEQKKQISFLYVKERIKAISVQFDLICIALKWEDKDTYESIHQKLRNIDENTKIEDDFFKRNTDYLSFFIKTFQIISENIDKIITTNISIEDEVLYATLKINDTLIYLHPSFLKERAEKKEFYFLVNYLLNLKNAVIQLDNYVESMEQKYTI